MKREEMLLLRFLSMLFPLRDGYIELRAFPAYPAQSFRRAWIPLFAKKEAVKFALKHRWSHNVHFSICTRTEEGRRCGKGTREFIGHLVALWADLDEEDFEWGLAEALEVVETFDFPPSALVSSGHGLHVYYFLDEPFPLEGEASLIEALLKALQGVLGSDRVSDVTRLLRLPCTLNLKDPDDPKPVEILHLENRRYALEEFLEVLDWEEELGRQYDLGETEGKGLQAEVYDGLEIVLQSDFIRYCRENAETLPEPLWYAMITNLISFKGGRKAIHELSRPYPRYSFEETEKKIEHALKDAPGPHTVRYIEEHGFRCEDCIREGVKSPAGLAFRVLSRKGPSLGKRSSHVSNTALSRGRDVGVGERKNIGS
jgi:putative DNA primase/helicase